MSYVQTYYHIVFSTKNRVPVLHQDKRKELYGYLWGILKNKDCHLYQLGGTEDHIHMLTSMHSTVCLAVLVRDLKTSSTSWIRKEQVFHSFPGWQGEYGAFTKSHSHRDGVIEYIRKQVDHHKTESFADELRRLLREERIDFEERHLL